MNTHLSRQTQNARTIQTPIMVCVSESLWDGYLGMRGEDTVLSTDVHSYTSSLCPEARSSYHERQVSWGGLRTQVTDVDNTECYFQNIHNHLKSPILCYEDKTTNRFVPNTTLKARMRAHTQISDLKPRNSASTQCCIYYNKPKTNHIAQFT